MTYINSRVASEKLNISSRRIQQMCKDGKITGAKKENGIWYLPDGFLSNDEVKSNKNNSKKKPLPVGISDFKKATSEYYYVDKTLLIKDFLDKKPQVSLFTRPRRFGKTLTTDMLRVFFEKTNEDTSKYFLDKKINSCGHEYMSYQGQYPVIFLSFKDVKCQNWNETYEKIKKLIAIEFNRHSELETSDKLTSYEKSEYRRIAGCDGDFIDYEMSLQLLSLFLYKHYEKEVVIIIDEYDTPIQSGHTYGFYNETIDFVRSFFSGGLKDNPSLAFGFLTGILRVAKESIFSGLNNLKINSILDDEYSEYFGFTKTEVKEILRYYDYEGKYDEISEWYDGYLFGNSEIYNPWSVINYVACGCSPKIFWLSTGNNDIIGEIIANANSETIENLYKLLNGEKITTYIDTSVIYPDINKNQSFIYSFLLVAGYLKLAKKYPQFDGNYMCEVAIPNKEIVSVYAKEILAKTGKENISINIQKSLFLNDMDSLEGLLEKFMFESISSFDGANESFYHGLMLGLCAIMGDKYKILSNRESGLGKFDVELVPLNKSGRGFIFEFKQTNDESLLEKLANEALKQIDDKKYDTQMRADGIACISKIGISFCGKHAKVLSKSNFEQK